MPRTLIAFIIALMVFAPPSARAVDRLVTVTGDATVAVTPDLAVIRIGVTTQGKTAREASEANSRKMTAVLTALKDSAIAEGDIQTSHLSLQPQYDTSKNGAARLLGFQVTNEVTVKIHNIDSVPGILDRAIGAGANEMSGIEFIVSEQSKLLDQARDEAIADARRKAMLYAQAAGGKLGRVILITEEGSAAPSRTLTGNRNRAVPIAPGEQRLRAKVSVSYELAQ